MKRFFQSFKNIKPVPMIVTVIVTLFYPVLKTLISKSNRLVICSDTLLIISLFLLVFGVLFSFVLKGDLDITRFVFRRGMSDNRKSFGEYKKDRDDEHRGSFNYPLFLGICYLAVSIFIAYVFCK